MASKANKHNHNQKQSVVMPGNPVMAGPDIDEAEIAARAYEIWHERGCPDGTENENWFRAQEELKQRMVALV